MSFSIAKILSFSDKSSAVATHQGTTKRSLFKASPVEIWKSRISWRIALSAFLTILTVQAGILNFTIQEFEQSRLFELKESARSAIAAVIHPTTDLLATPIDIPEADRVISTSVVKGFAIYSNQYDLIRAYGEPVIYLDPSDQNSPNRYLTSDGRSYEILFRSSDLAAPYIITARLDSSQIEKRVLAYVEQTILIMLLMSAFVTTVIMMALGYWLLEPILFIRHNLMAATQDPEDPKIKDSHYDSSDEIGGAIDVMQNLIRQNAANIRSMKAAAEDKIHKLAYYDTLTGLPNRPYFLQKLVEFMRHKDGENAERYAVVAMDIDHFKDINDMMGHNVGDAILRAIGKRLRAALPEHAIVSRSGEDEFAICMKLSGDTTNGIDLGEKILAVIRNEPFRVFNEEFQVRASVGVSTFPDDTKDADQILKNADIALNRAKEEGRDGLKAYSEDFDRAIQHRFQILRDLRDALENDDLTVFYQPQLDLRTGKVIGAEALIRWLKPDNSKQGFTFISPGDFIPVAESSGLIVPIGEFVLRKACHDAKEWNETHGFDVRVAVNVSAAQFSQSDLVAFTDKTLKEVGYPAHKLELEVTESVFMDDINHTIKTLIDLHSLGVELAIDDFGTGYSSLSYLRQFPIDRLKIDQSFIRNALNNADDASITKTIIGLGKSLNLSVIAEGVETKEHELFLQEHECEEVQGFRYCRPVKHDEFVDFVKNYNGKLDSFDKSAA